MIKEIVEFMDANEGIEDYFLKEKFNEVYIVLDTKLKHSLMIIDSKSKQQQFKKVIKNDVFKLTQYEKEKIFLLENKSKALPKKQINKNKGMGGASPFLLSFYYEEEKDNILFWRKKGSSDCVIDGVIAQLTSAITYSNNIRLTQIIIYLRDNLLFIFKDFRNEIGFAINQKFIKEKGNIKLAIFVSDLAINKFRDYYLSRKVFIYDKNKNSHEFQNGYCSICTKYSKNNELSSPAFLSNYGVDFSKKINLNIKYNQVVCSDCATKLEKFRYMSENNELTKPFPLFINKKSLFGDQKSILSNREKKKSYREIIKSIYYTNPKDLKNFYLLNYFSHLESGTWKFDIKDLDYIENFQYIISLKITNFLQIKNSFNLIDFYDRELSVFQFEKIINELVFDKKLQNNYFTDYKDIKITYWKINSSNSNSILKNYLIKYRQNFYDFIYKSRQSAFKLIDFREMLLDIIIDEIRHDKTKEVSGKYYSIYGNDITEQLNLLFSLDQKKETKLDSDAFVKLKLKMRDSLGYWQEVKDENEKKFIGGVDYIENDDKFFAFLCGQLARFLIGKKKGKDKNKSHADFSGFTDWQNSKLLKGYMWEIHRKYAHELKFDKKYDNAMSIVMTYGDDLEIDSVMEYMIAGYFSNNQIRYQDNKLEEN